MTTPSEPAPVPSQAAEQKANQERAQSTSGMDAEVRLLAREIRKPDLNFDPATVKKGVIQSVDAGSPPTLTVTISGSSTSVGGVRFFDAYNYSLAQAGDTVLLVKVRSDFFALGRIASTIATETVGGLDTRVTTTESDITSHGGRLDTAESDITSLDGRVDTLEANAPASKYQVDATNILNQGSTAWVSGSPEVGVTFTAPATGRVMISVGGGVRNNSANSDRVVLAPQVFEDNTSGTEVLAPTAHRGVSNSGVGGEDFQYLGHQSLLTGLTSGGTYYARVMHSIIGSNATCDISGRDVLVAPAS